MTPVRLGDRVSILAAAAALSLIAATGAVPNSNTVPPTSATRFVTAIGADDLKPAACSAMTLGSLRIGATGTNGNDLLLGSSGPDTMNARGGRDCVLGGGGNDAIDGGAGVDVCIGGPGADSFNRCETQL
jgi:Ca2+-binding RTX toxin-like protein